MKLRYLRRNVLDLHQYQLAEKLSCSQPLINHIENRKRSLTYLMALKLIELAKKSGREINLEKLMKHNRATKKPKGTDQ